MRKATVKEEIEFLNESNAIEGVYDSDSLDQAMYAWEWLKEQDEMALHVVLKTHKMLMLHQKLRPNEKGYFRQCAVWIGGAEGLDWPFVPSAVVQWCDRVSVHIKTSPKSWRMDHIRYEKIHPFVDGNGRAGRMFMNWQRLKSDLPLLVIHEGDEQMEYYKWFK